jgi:acetone carboxylase gamma subunit
VTSTIRLHGFNWHTHPRGWRDVIGCLLGRHQQILKALDDGQRVVRCSCGATSLDNGRTWSRAEHLGLRHSTPEPVGERP